MGRAAKGPATIATWLRNQCNATLLRLSFGPTFLSMPLQTPTDDLIGAALIAAKLRRTPATLALADLFARDPDTALSHAEAELALTRAGIEVNRVTVYRLLDRFAAAGMLRRTVDAQRVSRFSMAIHDDTVPRFECDDCHRQFRLADGTEKLSAATRQVLQALKAAGHEGHSIDVSVHGRCAGCAGQGDAVLTEPTGMASGEPL